jgi:hypothetical protein
VPRRELEYKPGAMLEDDEEGRNFPLAPIFQHARIRGRSKFLTSDESG